MDRRAVEGQARHGGRGEAGRRGGVRRPKGDQNRNRENLML